MQPSKGPQAGVLGPKGPRCGQWLLQSEQFHQVIIPCFLFLALGRSCEHVRPFSFYFLIVFFLNLTIVGLQRWASFSYIASDSFLVNCCRILTTVPCSSVSHSAMSDPVDCSPPSSSARGILRARILEWVAVSFSNGSLHYAVYPNVYLFYI